MSVCPRASNADATPFPQQRNPQHRAESGELPTLVPRVFGIGENVVPERSYHTRVHSIIARHVPSFSAAAARVFSLGDEARLRTLFEAAGLCEVEVTTEAHRFMLPSFEHYFEPIERGWWSTGQAFVALSEETRRAVREDVRRNVGDAGGPVHIDIEFMFASGRK